MDKRQETVKKACNENAQERIDRLVQRQFTERFTKQGKCQAWQLWPSVKLKLGYDALAEWLCWLDDHCGEQDWGFHWITEGIEVAVIFSIKDPKIAVWFKVTFA
jgi:hypothetical protein